MLKQEWSQRTAVPRNGGANCRRWKTRGSNNNFELINVNSGKCLEVQGGERVTTSTSRNHSNGARYQRWYAGYSLLSGLVPDRLGVPRRKTALAELRKGGQTSV